MRYWYYVLWNYRQFPVITTVISIIPAINQQNIEIYILEQLSRDTELYLKKKSLKRDIWEK